MRKHKSKIHHGKDNADKKKRYFAECIYTHAQSQMSFPKQQNDLTIHQVIQSSQGTHSYKLAFY